MITLPPPYCYLHLDTSTEKWTVHDEPGPMRVAVWTKHLIDTTPQPAQADTTPAAHGVEKDDGTSDYAVRQFGYWNREATERRRRDSVDSFDAYHEELRKRQASSAPGADHG